MYKRQDAGRSYFAQCRQALAQLAEAEREVMGQQAQPSGMLRISVPTTYGHHRILPMLPAFRERFPDIRLHVHLSNRNIDFVEEGYDMAVRVRAQPDSTLIARHLEDAQLVVVASRKYLRKVGTLMRSVPEGCACWPITSRSASASCASAWRHCAK